MVQSSGVDNQVKTIQELNAAKQEILLEAINTARLSRSQAEVLSTQMDKVQVKLTALSEKHYALYEAREVLINQAIQCEAISNA
jgi:hypothetical protein